MSATIWTLTDRNGHKATLECSNFLVPCVIACNDPYDSYRISSDQKPEVEMPYFDSKEDRDAWFDENFGHSLSECDEIVHMDETEFRHAVQSISAIPNPEGATTSIANPFERISYA